MQCARILVVTGASGVGKTTLTQLVESRGIAGVSFHYSDVVGVPEPEQMVREFGSAENWQTAMINHWIERLAQESGLCVLDGQMRPSAVREAFRKQHVDGHILLVDCSHTVSETRLRAQRIQSKLNTRDMACWASYLRGQADALALPLLDTTDLSIEDATDALHAHIGSLASV